MPSIMSKKHRPEFNLHCFLWNQTQTCLPVRRKASLLMPDNDEAKCNVYRRLQARSPGHLVLKRPKHPEDFQGKVYTDRVREGACDICDQFVDILPIGEVNRH